MAPSTKPRHTNSTSPSTVPLSTSVPNLVSTTPTSSEPTLQSTLNAPRPPVKKLVPCDALGRYLTSEDRRDRSFMAILAAFSTVNNQALCVKELVDVIRDNQLLNLGGATPSGTINSAIRNHVNRCVDRQLPCFLSRHVLSGDASDERLSPSIGVKPHHRRRAPPIVPGEPSFSDVAGSPSTTSFALHAPSSLIGAASISRSGTAAGAAAAPLSPTSPFAFSTSSTSSSPTSPTPSPSVVPLGAIHQKQPQNQTSSVRPSAQQLPQKEKIYLKNKNGRTRKGVCLWFLSPWTGFQNPFIREGFSNIGFLTDGKPVPEGEAYLSPIDFEFRWSLGTPSSPGFPAGGSGLKKDEMVMSVRPLDEMKVTTFFASATPPPSLVASASSTPTLVRAKPRKTPPSATSVPSASKTKVRDSNKLRGEPRDAPSGIVSSAAPTNGIINKRGNSSGGSPMRFLTPLQIPTPPGNSAAEASTSSTADDDGITGKQEQHQDQAKKDDRDSSSAGTDDTDAPLPQPQPQLIPPLASLPISSTIDTGSSDIEMDYSSDDAMSSSSDESDVAAETDLEDEQSEAATTVDPDEDLAHFGNWGYDDDAEDDDEDDEDGTLLITPRGSIVDGSPGSPSIHSPFAVTSAATSAKLEVHAVEDIQAFEGWCNFHAASTAMTMELSVGLNPHTPPIPKDIVSQVAPSVRPAPLLLRIPPHEHDAIPHDDDLGSPFTPLSSAISSERASPSPSSHPNTHQPVFDDLHMNLDIELAAQNGDMRRAAEDDVLIDELLVGPEGALPQEFEEAWDDGGIASAAGEQEDPESTYPASPWPSESSPAATRSTTPITGDSSRLRRYPYFGGSPSTASPRAIVDQEKHQSAAGTPGRTYCPGICVPMHRPASREGTYAEVDKGTTLACPSITITLPSTPPRTPSPYLKAAVVTPQAELDALIVPGAAVSESPTPAALLLPSEDELAANPVVAPKVEPYQYQPQMGIHPTAPPHLGSHQLEQIVINTTQPSNPPVCATFVDGVLVYTLTDPSTGQRLMRAVDTDYVHLSSLIAISHPPLRPRDACRIISLCHSPTIIMPSPPPAIPGVAPTITPLAGSWVPLEDAHMLCYTGELNIPQAVGELFLDRNLGEHYFPEPLPEWCKARRSLREPGIALCTAMHANGDLAVANANVSVMAALAELARMGETPSVLAPTSTPAPTPTEMISQLATPRSPDPPRLSTTRHPLLASLHASMQENQRSRSHEQDDGVVAPIMEPLSPALSALSPPSSHIDSVSNPPSLVRSVSATSVSSDSSALSSPPTTPPPLEMAPGPVPSELAELAEFPKKRGPGRPRKHRGASVIPAEDKKQQKARNVAAAAPVTSRTGRATARTLRSASGHWSSAYAS